MVNASPLPLLEAMNMLKIQKTGNFYTFKIRLYDSRNLLLFAHPGQNAPILGDPFFEQSNPTPTSPIDRGDKYVKM
jgi:hypothetical protein